MSATRILLDAFGRIRELVSEEVVGLSPEQLAFRLDPGANSIAWLVWHLARIEDDHVAAAAATLGRAEFAEQVWTAEGFARRFDLPFPVGATGYGHTAEDVARVTVDSGDLLTDYYDAVHARTVGFIEGLSEEDYETVIDTRWNPPVTLAVRLVSILGDVNQHVGQGAFVHGILERSADGPIGA